MAFCVWAKCLFVFYLEVLQPPLPGRVPVGQTRPVQVCERVQHCLHVLPVEAGLVGEVVVPVGKEVLKDKNVTDAGAVVVAVDQSMRKRKNQLANPSLSRFA